MKPAEAIISKFGGVNPMARALGHRNASTVQGWKERGFIPSWRQGAVLDKARELKIDISERDFFEVQGEIIADRPNLLGPLAASAQTLADLSGREVGATSPSLRGAEARLVQSDQARSESAPAIPQRKQSRAHLGKQ